MSEIVWASAYVSLADKKRLISAIREIYESAGYIAYDPFPGGNGTPSGISSTSRLFVARPESGWIRMIGEVEVNILKKLAEKLGVSLISVEITDDDSRVEVIGTQPLTDFLKAGKTPDDLSRAENMTPVSSQGVMPDELGDLAKSYGVASNQVEKLFQKTTRSIFQKLDKQTDGEASSTQSDAMRLLKTQFSWNSAPAQRVQAVMACLSVPAGWRDPSFQEIAAAYPVARLLDRNENAPLLPGDEDLLDKVEYPLDYTPVYYAKL